MRRTCHAAFLFVFMEAAWFLFSVRLFGQDLRVGISSAASHADASTAVDPCETLQAQSQQFAASWKYSSAATALQQALSVCSHPETLLLPLAREQMLAQQFNPALASLQRLLADEPKNIDAYITQGEILYLLNKDSDAQASLLQAIQIAPKNPDPHYWLGRIYYEDSRLQDAIAQFQEALKLSTDAYKAYDGLALCYENLGDIRLTVETYMKGLAVVDKGYPTYDVIYADFSEFLLRYGEDKKAFSLAAEAATRNPRQPRNFFLAGKAAEEEGQYDVSIRWLTRAAEIDPTYPDPHYLLARIYQRTGDRKSAVKESLRFQELSKDAPQVRR
jgi:tetratricopeptide (TPR) repeat protein